MNPDQAQYATFRSRKGIRFGGGHDIWVNDDANASAVNGVRIGHSGTFNCPTGQDNKRFLTGAERWQAAEIEVFAVAHGGGERRKKQQQKKDDTPPPPDLTERVQAYMKRVGLEAWYGYFQQHLPEQVVSVERLRATTSADLQQMATKANMRLDEKTTEQVLAALRKPTMADLKEREARQQRVEKERNAGTAEEGATVTTIAETDHAEATAASTVQQAGTRTAIAIADKNNKNDNDIHLKEEDEPVAPPAAAAPEADVQADAASADKNDKNDKNEEEKEKEEEEEEEEEDATVNDNSIRAKVTYEYEAEDATNITIAVGEVVVVSDKSDDDW